MSDNNVSDLQLDDRFPRDPVMLMSMINTYLRDRYPDGLDSLCADLGVDRDVLTRTLSDAGFEYLPEINAFR